MGITNKEISSVKLDPGYELTLYLISGSKKLIENNPNLKDFVPESIQITKKNNHTHNSIINF